MRTKVLFLVGTLFAAVGSVAAGPVELEAKETAPPTITQSEPWHFNLASPGWLASISGEVGLRGVNSNVDVDFGKIIRQVKGVASFSADARYDRFGVYADILYMGLSDAVYPSGLVSSAILDLSQYLIDGEAYYRVIECPRGSLDLRAGARYTDLYTSLKLVGDGFRIDEAATRLVNAANGDLRELLDRLLHGALDNKNPPLPVPPLGFGLKAKLVKLILAAKQNPDPMQVRQKIAKILRQEDRPALRRSRLPVGNGSIPIELDHRGNGKRIARTIANIHHNRRVVTADCLLLVDPILAARRNRREKNAEEQWKSNPLPPQRRNVFCEIHGGPTATFCEPSPHHR